MEYEVFFLSSQYYTQALLKSNQTLQIVECVSWQEESEKEGESKNTK